MFLSPHIPCLLKSATLKLTKDETRLALVTCVVEPFSRELAAELGADVVDHLFIPNPDRGREQAAWVPRPEVTEIGFCLPVLRQCVEVVEHPELPSAYVLRDVGMERIRVTRPDPELPRLTLSFVLAIILESKDAINFVVHDFGRLVYLSFAAMQRELPLEMDPDVRKAAKVLEIVDDFMAAQPEYVTVPLTHAGKTSTITPQMAEQARVRKKLRAKKGRR